MSDLTAKVRDWIGVLAAAERDGFRVYEGDDTCFILWLGTATRSVPYGPNILQHALDARLELMHPEEDSKR